MSHNLWAGGSTLPLTSWTEEGAHIYVSATCMPMTPAQARTAGQRLIELADQLEQPDPHAGALERLDAWKTRSGVACLICGVPVKLHGICNACTETGRQLDERPMSDAEQLADAMQGRR